MKEYKLPVERMDEDERNFKKRYFCKLELRSYTVHVSTRTDAVAAITVSVRVPRSVVRVPTLK